MFASLGHGPMFSIIKC